MYSDTTTPQFLFFFESASWCNKNKPLHPVLKRNSSQGPSRKQIQHNGRGKTKPKHQKNEAIHIPHLKPNH